MFTKAFWKAAGERMLRGAAVAIFSVFFVGDVVFDAFDLETLRQTVSLAIGGAFGSLLLSLIGNTVNGQHGPAFTAVENVEPQHRA